MANEHSPLLANLNDRERGEVLMRCRRIRFPAGAYVFHAGEAGDTVHVIVSGFVAVLSGGSLGDPVMLRVLGPGEAFGEQALLSDSGTRMATIQAITKTETRALSRSGFEELRRDHPAVDQFLVDVLAAEVRRLSAQIVEVVELPAATRIFRRLVGMATLHGADKDGDAVPVKQEHLASLACVKLRVTNRVLADARRDGLLRTERRQIVVLDWDRIYLRAQMRRPTTTS